MSATEGAALRPVPVPPREDVRSEIWNLPNSLTLFRIFLVPFLVVVLLTKFSDFLGLAIFLAYLIPPSILFIPLAVVLQSSRVENQGRALAAGASFLLKGSPTLLSDLRRFMIDQFGRRDNVIVASACSGHGFKHSAAVGELVAQMALGEKHQNIEHFRLRS